MLLNFDLWLTGDIVIDTNEDNKVYLLVLNQKVIQIDITSEP